MFKLSGSSQLTTPIKLQRRIRTVVSGAPEFSYEDALDPLLSCSFKSYGGTESITNGSLLLISTAVIVTWYRQDIQASDRIILLHDNSTWEVLGEPENIDMRNQYLMFKVQKISGGA